MWDTLAPWLAPPGVGGFLWLLYRLHRDAIAAEKGRADDARARAIAAEKRADLLEDRISILLGGRSKEPTV